MDIIFLLRSYGNRQKSPSVSASIAHGSFHMDIILFIHSPDSYRDKIANNHTFHQK